MPAWLSPLTPPVPVTPIERPEPTVSKVIPNVPTPEVSAVAPDGLTWSCHRSR